MVAIADTPGPLIATTRMFTSKPNFAGEIDVQSTKEWLAGLGDPENISITLETPGKFGKGVMAISSMWDSYGVLRATLVCEGYRHHRIPPQRWQKAMMPSCKKGETKSAALARAKQLWPRETWLASAASRVPHDGIVDAALIAEYSRIKKM